MMIPTLSDNIESMFSRGYAALHRYTIATAAATYMLLSPTTAAAQEAPPEKECHYQLVCDNSEEAPQGEKKAQRRAAVRKLLQQPPRAAETHEHPELSLKDHHHTSYEDQLAQREREEKKNEREHGDEHENLRDADKGLEQRTDTLERRVDLVPGLIPPRRIFMEVSAGIGTEYNGASRVEVGAAILYVGNRATVSLGASMGKAGEATSRTDLATAPTRELDEGYTVESTQTGTQTDGNRYLASASLGIAPSRAWTLYKGSRWKLQPSARAVVEFSRERETVDLTRTTQLYRGEEPVGDTVSASGSDTEYSVGVSLVPTGSLDIVRYLWGSDRGVGARFSTGYDIQNDTVPFGVSAVVRF